MDLIWSPFCELGSLQATNEKELKEGTDQFCGTLFEDPCRDFGFEVYITKIRGWWAQMQPWLLAVLGQRGADYFRIFFLEDTGPVYGSWVPSHLPELSFVISPYSTLIWLISEDWVF